MGYWIIGSLVNRICAAQKQNNPLIQQSINPCFRLLEIVNEHFGADALEAFFNELHMQRVHLVIVLRLLGGEHEIECDLIGLIHHGAMAADHFADVEAQHTGDGFEILVCASDQFIRRIGLRRIRPEDDNV